MSPRSRTSWASHRSGIRSSRCCTGSICSKRQILRAGVGADKVERKTDPATWPVTTGNGLAWSPDGATLYWADTASHAVPAWDFDMASATLGAARVFHQVAARPEQDLAPARQKRSAAELGLMPLSGCVLSMRRALPGLPVNFFLNQP
ncbi:MAG: SMP-30/gluconolactonase/LRE family protein [Rhodoferax sp.]